MRRQKYLDTDTKTIQKIEIVGQLKYEDGINADGTESMSILTISEKNQRKEIKIFLRKCNSIKNNAKL